MAVSRDQIREELAGLRDHFEAYIDNKFTNVEVDSSAVNADAATRDDLRELRELIDGQSQQLAQDRFNQRELFHGLDHIQAAQASIIGGGSSLKPRPFTGQDDSNGQSWIQKFLGYCNFANIAEERRCSALQLLLAGEAELWWTALPVRTKENWPQLYRAFLDRFVRQEGVSVFLKEAALAKRCQQPNESVESYLFDIRSRCQNLNKTENEMIKLALQGLLPHIRGPIMLHELGTFAQLSEKAKLAELSFASMSSTPQKSDVNKDALQVVANCLTKLTDNLTSNSKSAMVAAVNQPLPSRGYSRTREQRYCHNCNTSGSHDTRDCYRGRPLAPLPTTHTGPFCQRCGIRGHIAKYCRASTPLSDRAPPLSYPGRATAGNHSTYARRHQLNQASRNTPWRAYDSPSRSRDHYATEPRTRNQEQTRERTSEN